MMEYVTYNKDKLDKLIEKAQINVDVVTECNLPYIIDLLNFLENEGKLKVVKNNSVSWCTECKKNSMYMIMNLPRNVTYKCYICGNTVEYIVRSQRL